MGESIDTFGAARNLLSPTAQANPPPWFPILEELLNLANACVYIPKNAKAHPQTNASLPVVNCGKNLGADSGDLS